MLAFEPGAPISLATSQQDVLQLWTTILCTTRPFFYYRDGEVGISTNWRISEPFIYTPLPLAAVEQHPEVNQKRVVNHRYHWSLTLNGSGLDLLLEDDLRVTLTANDVRQLMHWIALLEGDTPVVYWKTDMGEDLKADGGRPSSLQQLRWLLGSSVASRQWWSLSVLIIADQMPF